jgi:predicted RNA-binding protein associated with RNAse of E/G family
MQTTSYDEVLVMDRPDIKVLLQDEFSGSDVTHGGSVILQHGAPIVWFIPVGSWHDIGRFHLRDGTFTGFYTNVSKPVDIQPTKWIGHDLCLDLWQPVDGAPVWLDEDEFDDAVRRRLIDLATKKRVLNERTLIELRASVGQWPPAIVRDIDLVQARALMIA